jgi:hypothetical protein
MLLMLTLVLLVLRSAQPPLILVSLHSLPALRGQLQARLQVRS